MRRFVLATLLVMLASLRAGAELTTLDELTGTDDEKAALASADQEKWVRAREQAEKILEKNPRSFLATWVIARVYHEGEGNHARALFQIRKAHDRLWLLDGQRPADELAVTWDKKLYKEEARTLLEMDRMDEMIGVLDRYDAIYSPKLLGDRAWALMKLRRYDEATALAKKLEGADDMDDRLEGYNVAAIIEYEQMHRDGAHKAALASVAAAQDRSCVLDGNAADDSLLVFDFAEAEALIHKALIADIKDCPVSPYIRLAPLFLVEGEFEKSISATKSLQGEPIEKQLRPQFAIESRESTAGLLYTLGKDEDAERIEADIYDMPGRTGMSSASKANTQLTSGILYWAILDARVAQEMERNSVRPFFRDLGRRAKIAALVVRRWEVEHAMLKIASDEHELIFALRPYSGIVDPWVAPTFAMALGPGVARKAIAEARAADAPEPGAAAYYDAYDGELDWRTGDYDGAIALAARALDKLPHADALLRWRVMAWSSDALRRRGKTGEADDRLREVLDHFPTMLRVLELAIPATVTSDGSPLARVAADRLRGSTRVMPGALARIDVSQDHGDLKICLGDGARQLGCGIGKRKPTDVATINGALDAFHDSALAPQVEMTQADISSLDGSPTRIDADSALKEILQK